MALPGGASEVHQDPQRFPTAHLPLAALRSAQPGGGHGAHLPLHITAEEVTDGMLDNNKFPDTLAAMAAAGVMELGSLKLALVLRVPLQQLTELAQTTRLVMVPPGHGPAAPAGLCILGTDKGGANTVVLGFAPVADEAQAALLVALWELPDGFFNADWTAHAAGKAVESKYGVDVATVVSLTDKTKPGPAAQPSAPCTLTLSVGLTYLNGMSPGMAVFKHIACVLQLMLVYGDGLWLGPDCDGLLNFVDVGRRGLGTLSVSAPVKQGRASGAGSSSGGAAAQPTAVVQLPTGVTDITTLPSSVSIIASGFDIPQMVYVCVGWQRDSGSSLRAPVCALPAADHVRRASVRRDGSGQDAADVVGFKPKCQWCMDSPDAAPRICIHCVPAIPVEGEKAACKCGHAWDCRDPVGAGFRLPSAATLTSRDWTRSIEVFYRPCSNASCSERLAYDGHAYGLFDLSNRTIFTHKAPSDYWDQELLTLFTRLRQSCVHSQLAGDSKQLFGGKRLSLAGCMERLVVQAHSALGSEAAQISALGSEAAQVSALGSEAAQVRCWRDDGELNEGVAQGVLRAHAASGANGSGASGSGAHAAATSVAELPSMLPLTQPDVVALLVLAALDGSGATTRAWPPAQWNKGAKGATARGGSQDGREDAVAAAAADAAAWEAIALPYKPGSNIQDEDERTERFDRAVHRLASMVAQPAADGAAGQLAAQGTRELRKQGIETAGGGAPGAVVKSVRELRLGWRQLQIEVAGALVARAATVTDSIADAGHSSDALAVVLAVVQAQTQQIASLVDLVHLLVSRVPGAPMQMPHAVPHAAHSAPRAAPAAKAAQPARPAAAAAPVASAAGAPAAERPAAAGAARAASARGPSRRGGLPARVGETSLCRSHVLSIPVAAATRLIAGRGAEGQMARDGIVRGALRDASYLGSTRHVRRLFSDCYGSEETAVAAAAVRVAAAAVDGVSLPVCLAMNLVRFVHDVSGRDRPAGGGVVSASFLNAKPAVGGIGVEPRRGGVLRVLFTVASDAVADTVVRSRRNLRDVDPSAAVFDVLSDREEAQHRALWPAFLAAKAVGKRAQFHRARLVVDGERAQAQQIASLVDVLSLLDKPEQCQAQLQSFVDDPHMRVLLVPLMHDSGAAGLTLTTVVIMEPSLDPALEAQAAARVHRMGQTKPTRIVRLVTAQSVEQAVLTLQAT
ncbi:hypothetical protein FOA52_006759 [Chlamydomonas sp. UWO 241]|nr:hypothetical protein FOA52_006759 [Chlamydomonas sp. UWO 241]